MEQKFKMGELVRLIGVVNGIDSWGENGPHYYKVELEGKQPFDISTVYINGKAIQKPSKDDVDFWKARGEKNEKQGKEKQG